LGSFVSVFREGLHGPGRVWAFNGVLAVACSIVWAVAAGKYDSPAFVGGPHMSWWALALAFYFAEVFVVHLEFRKQAHTLSLTEIGLTLGLMLGTPAGRAGHPDAVAAAAVYLASDDAAFVHGTVLDVDGGRVAVAVSA